MGLSFNFEKKKKRLKDQIDNIVEQPGLNIQKLKTLLIDIEDKEEVRKGSVHFNDEVLLEKSNSLKSNTRPFFSKTAPSSPTGSDSIPIRSIKKSPRNQTRGLLQRVLELGRKEKISNSKIKFHYQ